MARDISEVLEPLDWTGWRGPIPADVQEAALGALEDGKVAYFPSLSFALGTGERQFFSPGVAQAKAKNVSFDPASGALKHARAPSDSQAALAALMRRYSETAASFVRSLLPDYAGALETARTSFRPAGISGRALSPRKDDTRLHVDAFPSAPTGGKRILRIFTNVNPDGAGRDWRLGEQFEDVARRFLPKLPRRAPAVAWLLNAVGVTRSYRTAYDGLMLNLHNAMKSDNAYQRSATQNAFSFPPGSTWIVFTDKASHAAMGGQHLFEQTFYLAPNTMTDPSKSPLSILERLTGRTLV